MISTMSEEEKPPETDLEEGYLDPPTAAHMASQRRHLVDKTESESPNGHAQANGHPVPSTPPKSRKKPMLITYEELPEWYKDNEHIVGSYRPESFSASACFASLTYLHNETFNIYSHLIPAIVFLFAQAYILTLLKQQFPEAQPLDYIVFSFFLLCACITMSSSFMYHTLMNHSKGISFLWLRLDYVGILALILGDFVSGIRVGFYCDPTLQKIYWSMTLTLGLLTSILVIHPKYFQGLQYRKLRVVAFLSLALSGCIPIAHGLIIYGVRRMWLASGMPFYLLEGVILLLGAFFYATRCPESFKPGRFDIWGCSHNIFHVLVVVATVVHLLGIWKAFAYHHHERVCAA